MHTFVKSTVEDPNLVMKRRAQLVQAAVTLFSRVGYHASTIRDVAAEAGVSAGLIYQYISEKEELLFLTLHDAGERIRRVIPAALQGVDDPLARLHTAVDAYSRWIEMNQRVVVVAYRETKYLKPGHMELIKRTEIETNALLGDCLEACIRCHDMLPANLELVVHSIVTSAHAWALKRRLSQIIPFDEYLRQSIHCYWILLLSPKGKRRYLESGVGGAISSAVSAGFLEVRRSYQLASP